MLVFLKLGLLHKEGDCFKLKRYTEWVKYRHHKDKAPKWDEVTARELYNLQDDPDETVNLGCRGATEEVCTELSVALKKKINNQ